MANWMGWLVLAGALVILELLSGTFYLLMLAVGLLAGAAAAYAGANLEVQIVSAAVVGMIATIALHRSRFGWKGRGDAARDPNVNLDIGQFIDIAAWQPPRSADAPAQARVSYRGAPWDVELRAVPGTAAAVLAGTEPGHRPAPGRYRIVAVEGSRLIVAGER